MKKFILLVHTILLLAPAYYAFGDNIRGNVVNSIEIGDSSAGKEISFTMNIEDIFSVTVDRDSRLVKGFETEIRIPADMRDYGNSFALMLYKKISPQVRTGIGTYYGSRYGTISLPDASRFFIRVPFRDQLPKESVPYTNVMGEVLSAGDFPVMFTLLPLMKGFPSSLYSSKFQVTVRPLLKDYGKAVLDIQHSDGIKTEDITVLIDGVSIDTGKSEHLLPAGEHSIDITAPGIPGTNRIFTVTAGKTETVNIDLELPESRVFVDAPPSAAVYIDGEKIETAGNNSLVLPPGEHLVLFKIDDYKISKKFVIEAGKDCKISLFLDIFIE